jgi:hypothetical protein
MIESKSSMKTISMKTILTALCILLFAVSFYQSNVKAQAADDIIFKAMDDELSRNRTKLVIDNYSPPFFISYRFCDAQSLFIKATLGAINYSYDWPWRTYTIRLMVGDYSLNDENFVSGGQDPSSTRGSFLQLPLDNEYDAIRRSFWILSDRAYKRALEEYEQKLTALKQQNKSDEEKLDDYSKISPVNLVLGGNLLKYDKTRWEGVAKDISGVLKAYSQLYHSSAYITFSNAFVYVISNEGTKLKIPLRFASIMIYAGTQADDGESINNQLSYYALSPDQLPAAGKIKHDIKQLTDNIAALCKAPALKDSYAGPIIFEGEAVAEVFLQRLFRTNGLIASREPVYAIENRSHGSFNKLEDKLNQRICSENITIKATPRTKTFHNTPLIGSFEIDAEGVAPNDELVLVDKGILKTLLNDRVPTAKVKESNGYSRFGIRGASIVTQKAPGIINISYKNGESLKSLYKTVRKEAEKNGLEYVYIVRKLGPAGSRAISKPLGVYRLSTKTGDEQLVRSAILSDLPIVAFKQITSGTSEQIVYNTVMNSSIPVSFIVPQAIVFDDLSIEKDKSTKSKVPIVPNPLSIQE